VTHPEKKDKTPACDGQNIAATDVAAYRPPKYAYGRDFSKVSLLLHLLYKVSVKLTFEKKKIYLARGFEANQPVSAHQYGAVSKR